MELSTRQQNILKAITELFIATAQPVGSQHICQNRDFDCSPATIRNEMMALEESGLIFQPHTSSGRVPTPAGYRYYVNQLVKNGSAPLVKKELTAIIVAARQVADTALKMKAAAKAMAAMANNAVFIGQDQRDTYYTGLTYLFNQPEFARNQLLVSMSQLIDNLDKIVADLQASVNQTTVLIGNEGQLGNDCSLVVALLDRGVVGILGPTRMDYSKSMRLLEEFKQAIHS
jgi:heat-inducible transcriptional repressor